MLRVPRGCAKASPAIIYASLDGRRRPVHPKFGTLSKRDQMMFPLGLAKAFDGKLSGIVDEAAIYNRIDRDRAPLCGGTHRQVFFGDRALDKPFYVCANPESVERGVEQPGCKASNALQALDAARDGDIISACNRIQAFMNETRAQAGHALTTAQAGQLKTLAQSVKSSLHCR